MIFGYNFRGHLCSTPKISNDGLCIHAFPCLEQLPSPRRVLNGYMSAGDKNMTIQNCNSICKGSKILTAFRMTF